MYQLQQIWLHLTGGEQACTRARFALTMLVAYALYHTTLPAFAHCLTLLGQHAAAGGFSMFGNALLLIGVVVGVISVLLAFMPLSPLAILGCELLLYKVYRLFQGHTPAAQELPPSLWPYWAGFILCTLALLLAGSVAFGASWRRLKDSGRSPLFLLLGLTYLLGFDTHGLEADIAGAYLLGPLWLIILYSQPSKQRADFALFRQVP